jgi:hypothetical protein
MKRSDSSALLDPHLAPTPILDFQSEPVQRVRRQFARADSDLDFVRTAHLFVRDHVRPVYTVDELQPASVTLTKAAGSCSQRFACVEALARSAGIPTRVRGYWIAGEFWAPRFRWTRRFIPSRILLAWPQFNIAGEWIGIESIFGSLESLATATPQGFTNSGESLFDAVSHRAIDFHGRTSHCTGATCDLSRFAVGDAGTFASRDELFAAQPLLQRTLRGRAFELIYGGRKSV